MILITSSRKPSRRTRSLMRDLSHVIPRALRINRGKSSLWDLAQTAISRGMGRILVVWERKGNPRSFVFYRASLAGVIPVRRAIYFNSVRLRREIPGGRPRRVEADTIRLARMGGPIDRVTAVLAEGFGLSPVEIGGPSEIRELDCDVVLLDRNVGEERELTFFTADGVEVGPTMRVGGVFEFGGEGKLLPKD